jgi:hypothetical protein
MKILVISIVLLMAVLTGLSFFGKKPKSVEQKPDTLARIKNAVTATPEIPVIVSQNATPQTQQRDTGDSIEDSVRDGIRQALAKKFNRPAGDIILSLDTQDDRHAKGTATFSGEPEVKTWYGVLDQGEWIPVYDGKGTIDCVTADTYDFPKTIVPSCTDTADGNREVTR